MITRTRVTWAAMIALLSLSTACGGGEDPAPAGQATSQTPEPVSTQATEPEPTEEPSKTGQAPAETESLHGIIIAVLRDSSLVEIRSLDPDAGSTTSTRTFTSSEATVGLTSQYPGIVWRQGFNEDLTAVAASGFEQADGSQGAGFISLDGSYTQLTSDDGGYGNVWQKWPIGFNPESGDFWYMTAQGQGGDDGVLGYVDPSSGPESDTVVEGSAPGVNWATGGSNGVFFAPDGSPTDVAAIMLQGTVYLPGGNEVERDPVNWGFQIAPYGKVEVGVTPTTPVNPSDAQIGWMRLPVSDSSFLTEFEGQLYLNEVGSDAVSVKPLLPESNRQIGDLVVSPDGNSVAFVANAGSVTEMWVVSLSGDSVPVQLASFDPDIGPSYGLIDWLK